MSEWTAGVRRSLWQLAVRLHGEQSPRARHHFGRYVASLGGSVTEWSAGTAAYRSWARAAVRPGFYNRRHRKHLAATPDQAEQLNPVSP